MYLLSTALGPVDLAFTDRFGGVSAFPHDELDLALEGAGDPAARAENLRRVRADFAPDDELADLVQVHGREVAVIGADTPLGDAYARPEADAVVTDRPGVTLLVRMADCVPVLLADPEAGVVGAVHAGRPGVVAGVVAAAVDALRDLGARRLHAWIGPHVCGHCYEVPFAMRAEVGALLPESVQTTWSGTPSLDLGAGVRAQLAAAGVEDVVTVPGCTRERSDLFSYRRDGADAGRLGALIRIDPARSAAGAS